MMLVTLEQAKDYLRMDHDDDDAEIERLSEAASEAVLNYLKDGALAFLDSDGQVPVDSEGNPMGVPRVVQAATLMWLADIYTNREGQATNPVPTQWGYMYPNNTIVSMLAPLRDPALR